jgi:hypothetical protein
VQLPVLGKDKAHVVLDGEHGKVHHKVLDGAEEKVAPRVQKHACAVSQLSGGQTRQYMYTCRQQNGQTRTLTYKRRHRHRYTDAHRHTDTQTHTHAQGSQSSPGTTRIRWWRTSLRFM